jgi:hypothetical protein
MEQNAMSLTAATAPSPPDDQAPWGKVSTSAAKLGIFLLLALAFLVAAQTPLWHTDVWGHLRFGQWIAEQRALPAVEPFVPWIGPAQPYDGHAWLSQLILYEVYDLGGRLTDSADGEVRTAGGVVMLRLLHALLFTLHLALLACAYQRLGGNWWLTLIAVGLTWALSMPGMIALRPQVFGQACYALLLLTLARPAPSLIALIGMPALFVVWANLHGSFMVGLATLLGFAGGRMLFLFALHGVTPRAYWTDLRFRRLIRIFYVSILLIGLLNPSGFGLFAGVYRFGSHPNVADMDEWQKLDWESPLGAVFLATLAMILLTHLTGLIVPPAADRPDRKFGVIPLGQLILLVAFGLQTYYTQRLMTWWVMLAPWICIGPWAGFIRGLTRRVAPQPSPGPRGVLAAMALLLTIVFWFSAAGQWLRDRQPPPLDAIVSPGTPLNLVRQVEQASSRPLPLLTDWLSQHGKEGFPGHLFASETQGDYLVWALPIGLAPEIYTHVHLFAPEHWRKVHDVKFAQGDWRKHLDDWKVNLLVFEAEIHPHLRRQLHADPEAWQVVLDEFADARKPDPRTRLMIVVRKQPLR